jgi:hypothetical protein
MSREELDSLLYEIRHIREQVLVEQNDLTEADFELSTISQGNWRWDTLRRVLLQFGNHMREHATHIQGVRAAIGRPPTQPQRILAEAEIAWGNLLASTVGLTDDDLDAPPPDESWSIRRILEHTRDSEAAYLEAIRKARL